ncbi:hypothetical protein CBR_g31530 [Chara braunii]|uniref:FHA domain-containing protein n=1 Tax=Chara braunii TaxID=69332 RepID=A0A388LF86_CHABU|nr:hypothetical protein CBR_g31530 [Chara braunii]|eukprot:GBG80974.1 hypothetical protein CBR_g31530 [Chara braunii]
MLNRFKRAQEPEPFKVDQFQVNPAARPQPASQQQISSAVVSRQNSAGYAASHYSGQQQGRFSGLGGAAVDRLGGGGYPGGGYGGPSASAGAAAAALAAGDAAAAAPPVQGYGVGQGLSTYAPPEWAIEPKAGVYYLEVIKDGSILDNLALDRRRTLFGRQAAMCDIILDHPSVSRQHAVIVHHKSGSVYVIDLGSAHGTFVSNERLAKDAPTELEIGCSVRFAASTRSYILRRNGPPPGAPSEVDDGGKPLDIELPSPPDPSDEEAVLTYNTILNRWSIPVPDADGGPCKVEKERDKNGIMKDSARLDGQRPAKRIRRARVTFRDDFGGELALVVGVSDGADVGTDVGPVGVKEGSTLVGKYESLVKSTIVPHGQDLASIKASLAGKDSSAAPAITNRLKQFLDRSLRLSGSCKGGGGLYGDLYENLPPGRSGSGSGGRGSEEGEARGVNTGTSAVVDEWKAGEEGGRARRRSDDTFLDSGISEAEDGQERGRDGGKEKGSDASYGGGSGGHRKYPVEKWVSRPP